MDLLNKIFKIKQKRSKEYQDLSKDSKKVPTHQPSDLLLYARDIAGSNIQKRMTLLNECRWIRAEYTYPAFDNMNFIYKNKIFSVIIEIQDEEGNSYIPEEYVKRQLNASKKYNLIPCKFPVVVDNPHEPDFETVKPKNNGWNLYHTKTNEIITPEHMATTDKIKMSEWEMRNFGIVFVRKYLSAKQLKVLSFQDTLEVDPQIWFEDANGKKCWLLVRCAQKSNNKIPKPNKLNEIIRRCFKNNGYFAGVSLEAIDEKHLYRGGKINIEFEGIEKIHSVL